MLQLGTWLLSSSWTLHSAPLLNAPRPPASLLSSSPPSWTLSGPILGSLRQLHNLSRNPVLMEDKRCLLPHHAPISVLRIASVTKEGTYLHDIKFLVRRKRQTATEGRATSEVGRVWKHLSTPTVRILCPSLKDKNTKQVFVFEGFAFLLINWTKRCSILEAPTKQCI